MPPGESRVISKLDHFVHGLEQTSFENPDEKNIPA